ncbi:tachylectin-related carbohydrate-binding protein [Amycolatopsis sp. NPDC059021]|uniref:tachylectin-related carbohydrate-binding protein n=1 Tax=Amycolatopsis sp. NPDC059021 TaxID=3346704 RepID=UPI00366DBB5A
MRQRRSLPRAAALCSVLTVALGSAVAVSTVNVAVAADSVTCRESASVFYTRPDTYLDLDHHNEPETGVDSWTGRSTIGYTWSGRTLAGPDGRLYLVGEDGKVTRQRRLANSWENDGVGQVIATGWYGWNLPQMRNRITVDTAGDFYWSHDNILGWLRYDEATKTWTDRLIDTGWTPEKYDLIVAAGYGVFYARTPAGDLYRFHYDAASQRWVEYAKQVGNGGWQNFATIASPGGDILYTLDKNTGQLKWYRYLGGGVWADNSSRVVTAVSADWQVAITSDDCKLVNPGQPQRPAVPSRTAPPSFVTEGTGGKLQHFYIDDFGRLIHGRQRSDDITVVEFTLVPGYQQFSGIPSAFRADDDSLLVAALGQDSETRTSTQVVNTTKWSSLAGFGGWTPGPASLVKRDKLGYAFAVDAAGKLWARAQDANTKQFLPWAALPSAGLTPDITVVAQPDGIDVLARTTSGTYTKATYLDGTLGPWLTVPGTGWTKNTAAVANPDKNLQVFATQPDGVVVTQREMSDGFTGTWKPLPGVTATGAPAAAVDTAGIVHVAVRASDGFVYVTEQSAPGSTAYRTWERLKDSRTGVSYPSVTDPAMTARTGGGVAVTFRDADGTSYAYGTGTPPAVAARSAAAAERTVFIGGPLPKPHL